MQDGDEIIGDKKAMEYGRPMAGGTRATREGRERMTGGEGLGGEAWREPWEGERSARWGLRGEGCARGVGMNAACEPQWA